MGGPSRHEFGDRFGGHFGGAGGPGGRGPGGRRRRGDMRTGMLSVLLDGPGHGYELIQRIEAKSEGAWKPSPGSVYPTLQLLEDEELVRSSDHDGKKVYEITDAGRAEVERRLEEAGGPPWADGGGDFGQLRQSVAQLAMAARQVAMTGDAALVKRAAQIVTDARKQLYQMLAE